MENAIDERRNAIDKRHFSPLFEVSALTVLYAQFHSSYLLCFLFEKIIANLGLRLFLVEVVKEPYREAEQDDGCHHGNEHKVQLGECALVLAGTGFQLTVLTGKLLKVEIEVTVVVALGFVVDGGIGHTKLFADGGHEVGGLIDGGIGESLF